MILPVAAAIIAMAKSDTNSCGDFLDGRSCAGRQWQNDFWDGCWRSTIGGDRPSENIELETFVKHPILKYCCCPCTR